MTSPKLSSQIPDPNNPYNADGIGRMYARVEGGTPEVPSITTIIDVMNPKMEWWRGLCAGREAIRVAPLIVRRQSELVGEALAQKEREIVQWIDEAAVRDMRVAAQRGDLVHNYAEYVCRHMLGEEYDIQHEKDFALEGLERLGSTRGEALGFLNNVESALSELKIEPIRAEGTVWNSTVGYAGTNDLFCLMNGVPTLVDYKTKKKVKSPSSHWYSPSIKPTIALQLEAARQGEEVYDEATSQWVDWDGREAVEQVGIAIAPNGYEAIRVKQSPSTWETFKALRVAWEWGIGDKLGREPHIENFPLTLTSKEK